MIKYLVLLTCLLSMLFSVDMNFSLETKYGKDKDSYEYAENILDISATKLAKIILDGRFIFIRVCIPHAVAKLLVGWKPLQSIFANKLVFIVL